MDIQYIYVWRDRANKIPRKHTLAGIARAKENAMDDFPFSIFCALQWNFLVVAMLNFLFAVTTRPLPSFSFDFELCIRRFKVSQKKINCQLLFILLLTLHYLLDLMSGGTTTVNIFFWLVISSPAFFPSCFHIRFDSLCSSNFYFILKWSCYWSLFVLAKPNKLICCVEDEHCCIVSISHSYKCFEYLKFFNAFSICHILSLNEYPCTNNNYETKQHLPKLERIHIRIFFSWFVCLLLSSTSYLRFSDFFLRFLAILPIYFIGSTLRFCHKVKSFQYWTK